MRLKGIDTYRTYSPEERKIMVKGGFQTRPYEDGDESTDTGEGTVDNFDPTPKEGEVF